MKIDYSGIAPQQVTTDPQQWEPPRHVFFGRKDPNTGRMAPEPASNMGHGPRNQFPSLLYRKEGESLKATLVNSEAELKAALDAGYVDSPAKFGVVSAPSFEQIQEAKTGEVKQPAKAESAKPDASDKSTLGLPTKKVA